MSGLSTFAGVATAALLLAAPAFAQSTSTGTGAGTGTGIEVIQTTTPRPGDEASLGRAGMRMVKPGALLLATFDQNLDGQVTDAEVEAGARRAFQVADKDANGALGGFEQGDWARTMGAEDDVLSNPMLFDVDLDRSVTPDEFLAGMRRLALSARAPDTNVVKFTDLLRAPGRSDRPPAD